MFSSATLSLKSHVDWAVACCHKAHCEWCILCERPENTVHNFFVTLETKVMTPLWSMNWVMSMLIFQWVLVNQWQGSDLETWCSQSQHDSFWDQGNWSADFEAQMCMLTRDFAAAHQLPLVLLQCFKTIFLSFKQKWIIWFAWLVDMMTVQSRNSLADASCNAEGQPKLKTSPVPIFEASLWHGNNNVISLIIVHLWWLMNCQVQRKPEKANKPKKDIGCLMRHVGLCLTEWSKHHGWSRDHHDHRSLTLFGEVCVCSRVNECTPRQSFLKFAHSRLLGARCVISNHSMKRLKLQVSPEHWFVSNSHQFWSKHDLSAMLLLQFVFVQVECQAMHAGWMLLLRFVLGACCGPWINFLSHSSLCLSITGWCGSHIHFVWRHHLALASTHGKHWIWTQLLCVEPCANVPVAMFHQDDGVQPTEWPNGVHVWLFPGFGSIAFEKCVLNMDQIQCQLMLF